MLQQRTDLIAEVMRVTCLIIEGSSSKNCNYYNSYDHLLGLLACSNIEIVLGALEVLTCIGRFVSIYVACLISLLS